MFNPLNFKNPVNVALGGAYLLAVVGCCIQAWAAEPVLLDPPAASVQENITAVPAAVNGALTEDTRVSKIRPQLRPWAPQLLDCVAVEPGYTYVVADDGPNGTLAYERLLGNDPTTALFNLGTGLPLTETCPGTVAEAKRLRFQLKLENCLVQRTEEVGIIAEFCSYSE